ncbi:hypothetical protein ACI65C_004957 [Semiaphis heraclei]
MRRTIPILWPVKKTSRKCQILSYYVKSDRYLWGKSTLQRICKESKTISLGVEKDLCIGSSTDIKFRSPRKRYSRNKPVTDLDDFDSEVVRNVVQSFYDKGEFPTSSKILAALPEKPDYWGRKIQLKSFGKH